MNIRLSLDDAEDERSLASLYRWLLEDEVARETTITLPQQVRDGEMGGVVEFVDVVVGNGIALGSLLLALAAWRGSRSRPPAVRIEHGETVVLLQDDSPENVRRIVDALSAEPREGT